MVVVRGAPPVHGLAAAGAQDVDLAGVGQRLQRAVDGGQADALADAAQLLVDLLRGAEVGEPVQQARHRRRCWPRAPRHAPRSRRGRRPRRVVERAHDAPSSACATASTTMCARWSSTSEYTTSRPRRSPLHDARRLEHPQVLADQGLGHGQRVDEVVHAARRLAQLQHDRDPHGSGQRAQQVAGRRVGPRAARGPDRRADLAGMVAARLGQHGRRTPRRAASRHPS